MSGELKQYTFRCSRCKSPFPVFSAEGTPGLFRRCIYCQYAETENPLAVRVDGVGKQAAEPAENSEGMACAS